MTTIYVSDSAKKKFPKRRDFDFYPTPLHVAVDALSFLPTELEATRILDPGAGTGIWGRAARRLYPYAHIMGYEVRTETEKPNAYDVWRHEDFLLSPPFEHSNLVIGNPPYEYAEQFVRGGLDNLLSGGYLIFLLRLNFLESQARVKTLYRDYPPQTVIVRASRVSFTGDGQSNATAYAYFIWQKGWKGETVLKWSTQGANG